MKQNNLILSLIFFGFIISNNLSAQWNNINGIYGEWIWSLAVNDENIIAGTEKGIFLSKNNGLNWIAEYDGVTNNHTIRTIVARGSYIYAGTNDGKLFLSTNNGNNWILENSDFPSNTIIFSLTVIDTNIIAATNNGVYISSDGGISWSVNNKGLSNTFVRSITKLGSYLYAGTSGGIFRSNDNGSNWSEVNNGITNKYINTLAVKDSLIFAGTMGLNPDPAGGIYLSTNNGNNWTNSREGIPLYTTINTINIIGPNIYAGTSDGIFCSSDDGKNWKLISKNIESNYILSIASRGNDIFMSTTEGVVYLSNTDGNSWTALTSGIPNQSIKCMSSLGSGILAGTQTGIYCIEENGINWKTSLLGLTNKYVNSLGTTATQILVGTNEGIYFSTNKGLNWNTANNNLPENTDITSLFISGDDYYVGTRLGELYLTTDLSADWKSICQKMDNEFVFVILTNESNIYIGTVGNWYGYYGSIYKSTNSGSGWQTLNNGIVEAQVYSLAYTDSKLLAGTQKGLYLSQNEGINWQAVTDEKLFGLSIRCVYVTGQNIFLGTSSSGVILSTDFGANWEFINDGFPNNITINSILVKENKIFVATDQGVFQRSLGEVITCVHSSNISIPNNYDLCQNYPNPFNSETIIKYHIPRQSKLTLKIYDLLGRLVTTLVNEVQPAGSYNVPFDARNLSSGVYFYILETGERTLSKKLILLK